MPYVQRSDSGQIIGAFENLQPSIAEELLDNENAELTNFLSTLQRKQKTQFTSLEFLDKFSQAEQLSVVEASMTNAAVKLWYDRLLAASFVDLEDSRIPDGLNALVAAGLLEASRVAEIMTPEEQN